MTFEPHPAQLLAPDRAPARLTLQHRKVELLKANGADEVFIQPFDRSFSQLSPEQFFESVLVNKLHAAAIVTGENYCFGANRSGDIGLLRELGSEKNVRVETHAGVQHQAELVSSSRIRNCVATGQVEKATDLLGRVYDIEGSVVEGDKRARTLGFPTANMDCEDTLSPANGVYAVLVKRLDAPEGTLLRGVLNLGHRPTFQAGKASEVHLLDFDQNIYGARLRIGFCVRIRSEKAFPSAEALVRQIRHDIEEARARLQGFDPGLVKWL